MSHFVVSSQARPDSEEERHSLSPGPSSSRDDDSSRSIEIGIRGPPQVKFHNSMELRILSVIWVCYLWDKQLEKIFVQQHISVENASTLQRLEERKDIEPAALAFFIGRAVGVWLALVAMIMDELARMLPASMFITGLFATFLNYYSGNYGSLRIVCYAFCAISSAPLMPTIIILAQKCFRKLTNPFYSILWATAGPVGIFVSEMNLLVNEKKMNLPILIEGLFAGMIALAIEPIIMKIKSSSVSWLSFERTFLVFDTESHSNIWSRFQALWRLCKNQIRGSLEDPQIYFFLLFAIVDASTKREVKELLKWKFADALAQTSPLIAYLVVGSTLYCFKARGCLAFLMAVSIFAEGSGWWLLGVCYSSDTDTAQYSICSPVSSWLVSLVPAIGEITITLAIILLIANVRGRVRSIFVATTFCTGHALGGLARTLLIIGFSIDQWHKVVFIASMIKFIGVLLYIGKARDVNLKRKQGMNVVEAELIGASWESVLVEEDMDFENERFLFTY